MHHHDSIGVEMSLIEQLAALNFFYLRVLTRTVIFIKLKWVFSASNHD